MDMKKLSILIVTVLCVSCALQAQDIVNLRMDRQQLGLRGYVASMDEDILLRKDYFRDDWPERKWFKNDLRQVLKEDDGRIIEFDKNGSATSITYTHQGKAGKKTTCSYASNGLLSSFVGEGYKVSAKYKDNMADINVYVETKAYSPKVNLAKADLNTAPYKNSYPFDLKCRQTFNDNGDVLTSNYYFVDSLPAKTCEYSYNHRGQIVAEKTVDYNNGGDVTKIAYTYDNKGLLVKKVVNSVAVDETYSYVNNDKGDCEKMTIERPYGTVVYTFDYEYDSVDNWTIRLQFQNGVFDNAAIRTIKYHKAPKGSQAAAPVAVANGKTSAAGDTKLDKKAAKEQAKLAKQTEKERVAAEKKMAKEAKKREAELQKQKKAEREAAMKNMSKEEKKAYKQKIAEEDKAEKAQKVAAEKARKEQAKAAEKAEKERLAAEKKAKKEQEASQKKDSKKQDVKKSDKSKKEKASKKDDAKKKDVKQKEKKSKNDKAVKEKKAKKEKASKKDDAKKKDVKQKEKKSKNDKAVKEKKAKKEKASKKDDAKKKDVKQKEKKSKGDKAVKEKKAKKEKSVNNEPSKDDKKAIKEREAAEKKALKVQEKLEKQQAKEQAALEKRMLKEQKAAEKQALKEQKELEKQAKKASKE